MKGFILRVISMIVTAAMITFFAPGGARREAFDVTDPNACLLDLTVFSDVHVEGNNYPRYKVFVECLRDAVKNKSGSDAFLFLGDNTMNGQNIENMIFHGTLAKFLKNETVIALNCLNGAKTNACGTGVFERNPRFVNAISGIIL